MHVGQLEVAQPSHTVPDVQLSHDADWHAVEQVPVAKMHKPPEQSRWSVHLDEPVAPVVLVTERLLVLEPLPPPDPPSTTAVPLQPVTSKAIQSFMADCFITPDWDQFTGPMASGGATPELAATHARSAAGQPQ